MATLARPACVSNADLAAMMRELADLLALRDANPFRIRAYRNLARTLDTLTPSVQDMLAQGERLEELPGVGHDLAGKMGEMVATGSCALLDELRQGVPPGMHELMDVPGLGPRKVAQLHAALGIGGTGELVAAARDGRLQGLRGFGGHTVERLLAAIAARQGKGTRMTRASAAALGAPLLQWLQGADLGALVQLAGSYRRCRDMVGDLDIVASAVRPASLIARLLEYADVQQVLAHGPTRASVRLRQGLQVDLRVVPAASYGAALLYFTGSRAHNIALRRLATQRGWKLNEYGLFEGARRLAGATEQDIYAALELDFIAPELREERGELQAAPRRLDLDDVWCRTARDMGVMLCINSDAHSRFDFADLAYGIDQARRGWLRREDVLNCLPLAQLRRRLRRRAPQ